MTDLERILENIESRPPSLWNVMRFGLGFSVEQSNEIVEAVEKWLPKEDPRPSYATMQWDKCVRGMHERLWDEPE